MEIGSMLFIPIAQHTVPGFYQSMRKTARNRDMTMTRGVPWANAFAAASNSSTAIFQVDLATNVKSKQYFWYARKQRLTMGGLVDVGSGLKGNQRVMNFSAENVLVSPGNQSLNYECLEKQFLAIADEKYDDFRLGLGFIKEYIFSGGCLPLLSRTSAMAAAFRLGKQKVLYHLCV
ncbi:UNVERIFIED_CONTAM: Protein NDR1 [Sesamum indicum]